MVEAQKDEDEDEMILEVGSQPPSESTVALVAKPSTAAEEETRSVKYGK